MAGDAPATRVIRSVRFRVTLTATVAVLAVLVATGVGLVWAQTRVLTDNLDETLALAAADIADELEADGAPATLVGPGDDDSVAQVVDGDGEVLASSANIVERGPLAESRADGDGEVRRTVDDIPTDEARFRLLSKRIDVDGEPLTVHVAVTLDDIEESRGVLARSLLVAVPLVVAVVAALIWWLVGRTLRPVEAIRAEVADIGGGDLHRRVPEPRTGDEVDRLARTMNTMLDRVESASQRQQRFTADAAHELRSPLTRIRTAIEVDAVHPETADLPATHASVLEEAIGLERMVGDLLHLSRSDAGAVSATADTVDLDDIALGLVGRLRAEGRVVVDSRGVGPAQVRGDSHQLRRAVGNVVENAARFAASSVAVTVVERDGTAHLTVADDGPGIAAEDHSRVFERFTRLDDARARATGGTGLGLAIARDIVERHGGTIAVADQSNADLPGACFVMTFPSVNGTAIDNGER